MEARYLRYDKHTGTPLLLTQDALIAYDNDKEWKDWEKFIETYSIDMAQVDGMTVLVDTEEITTYDALFEIKKQRVKWREANRANDLASVQEVRDSLSDFFFDYGYLKAKLHAQVRLKENERKDCYDEMYVKLKDKSDKEGLKWTGAYLESKARLACKEQRNAEKEAIDAYEYMKEILERGDQILNSAASKIKLHSKI